MKLAIVTPRYGTEVTGGAEHAARALAERLATRADWQVEAFTTCARDASTWANEYDPGDEILNGVTVHRFAVSRVRRPDFDRATARVVYRRSRVSMEQQEAWLEDQGPLSPGLVDAIRTVDVDSWAFHPYLYHPTVIGIRAVADRAVLHPAAHDEAPIHLPVFRDVFLGATALAYWSDAERRLVEHLFPVAARPQAVVGLGVDSRPGDAGDARAALGLGDDPFLLCLGRVDDGKGVGLLTRCFTAYKERRPGPLRLVFAGPVVDAPEAHSDIVVAGRVDEDVKWGLLRAADALVSPSAYESFSIVLLEAWCVGTPALVNGFCAVTREHAARANGGLAFRTYPDFEVALDRLLGSPALASAMGAAGRAYVEAHYRWSDVIARYAVLLERTVSLSRR
jgi:glycosyltransferase involved in cell wall biosynthesis